MIIDPRWMAWAIINPFDFLWEFQTTGPSRVQETKIQWIFSMDPSQI
jgi:hypothetical protein